MLSISQCLGDTCYCTCCSGNFCQPTLLGNLTISSCASSSCKSLCQTQFPQQCTDGSGSTLYGCRSSGGGSQSTANWVGVFDVKNHCDQRVCCCPTGQIINTKFSGTLLHVYSNFIGQECPSGSMVLDETIGMPSGYTTQLTFFGSSIQATLSQDSRTIQITNTEYPQCSETAIRINSSLTTNINTTLLLLSIILFSFKKLILFE